MCVDFWIVKSFFTKNKDKHNTIEKYVENIDLLYLRRLEDLTQVHVYLQHKSYTKMKEKASVFRVGSSKWEDMIEKM